MLRKLLTTGLLLALAACVTTSGNDPKKMAQGYYDRGISYLQVKDYERALVEFQRSLQTDSGNKMPYYALGVVHDLMGKLDDAVAFYKQALDIDSEFSEAHNALGVVYTKQQKWKDALKSFREALENKLYATPHVPYMNMGDLFMTQQEYLKAVDAYRESKRLVNQDIIAYKIGVALLNAGNVHDAVVELREGASMSPKNPDIRLALGLALLKEGNKKAARAEFREVAAIAPKSEQARTAQDYITTLDGDAQKTNK